MKRLLLCTAIAAATFAAPPPATAHTDSCAGQGDLVTMIDLGVRGTQQAKTTAFNFLLTLGTCASKTSFAISGTLTGWCNDFYGYGVTQSNHRFGMTSTGGDVTFTGEVTGKATVAQNPGCVNKTARRFTTSINVTKTHATAVTRPQPLESYCASTFIEC